MSGTTSAPEIYVQISLPRTPSPRQIRDESEVPTYQFRKKEPAGVFEPSTAAENGKEGPGGLSTNASETLRIGTVIALMRHDWGMLEIPPGPSLHALDCCVAGDALTICATLIRIRIKTASINIPSSVFGEDCER
ncbi:hypothetical protein RB195_011306 [Necator americanus]|uniref:Uncharacterized protein n=1 Tax=Necator americanus TaxID=51031 RepID=A0ABR1D1Z1_NECAM